MPLTNDQQYALLIKYDSKIGYCPDDFNYLAAYQKVAPLRSAIENALGGECVEQDPAHIHDMCVYAELFIPKHIGTESEWTPCIVLSTFGDMARISGYALVTGALDKLKVILSQMGFQYISEAVASAPYDGVHTGIKTWSARYFEWL